MYVYMYVCMYIYVGTRTVNVSQTLLRRLQIEHTHTAISTLRQVSRPTNSGFITAGNHSVECCINLHHCKMKVARAFPERPKATIACVAGGIVWVRD